MEKWIPVTTLPPVTKHFGQTQNILFTDGERIFLGYVAGCELGTTDEQVTWYIVGADCYTVKDVTHWMPLPELP